MVTMFVRHKVQDFKRWKNAYDAFDAERKKMGVRGHGVYQDRSDPNDLTVYHDFNELEEAKKFADSPRLKEVMKEAGVTGTPEIWFTSRV